MKIQVENLLWKSSLNQVKTNFVHSSLAVDFMLGWFFWNEGPQTTVYGNVRMN